MDAALRFILLLPEGPLELPFAAGQAQILATTFRGAPSRRINVRAATPDALTLDQGEDHVLDGERRGPGRARLGPGSLISIGKATAIVLPCGDPNKPPKFWKKLLPKLAEHDPLQLIQLGSLGDSSLTRAVVEAARHISLADATKHARGFAELIAAALTSPDANTRKHAVAAAAGKQSLLDPAAAATVVSAARTELADKQAAAAAAADHAARTSPEHDGAADEPTIAWDLVFDATDRGHGWLRGESSLPPDQRPRDAGGEPLTHLCTVLVPREYRAQAPELVALALFQALKSGPAPTGALAHPHEQRFEDHIGGAFAVIWLTADELRHGPHGADHRWVALRARHADRNVGKPTNSRGYVRPSAEITAAYARNHFGGTTESHETKVQPKYLHIDQRDVGGNFAGDDAHLELVCDDYRIVWGED